MSNTVTIDNREHPMSKASVMVLSPLLAAMGVTEDDSGRLAGMDEGSKEQYGRDLLKRLAEPSRHYQIAFTLSRLFPSVPDSILSYRVWSEGDRRYEDFTLDLEVEELAAMIQVAMSVYVGQSAPTPNTPEPEPAPPPRSKPRGFAQELPPAKPKAPPAAIRPEVVSAAASTPALTGAELAMLEDLTDEAVSDLRSLPQYLPILKASGVTENLFNFIKAQ